MSYRLSQIKNIVYKFFWSLKYIFSTKAETVNSSNISIIVVGRNDNYGGDFSLRLKTTIDWNLKQLPGAELIYIEWNKIEDRESDCVWIEKNYPNAKCYIVSNQVHQTVTQNQKMPVMEYFAKNLGIRKANKDWILLMSADCFIGNNTKKRLHHLNKNYVYGTHYVSIDWDGKSINEDHLKNRKKFVVEFSAPKKLGSVVGNFILTHKNNWLKATGYDETLTNVRAGVDTNGMNQLLYFGLKPMVLGTHYHLDHPESIVHGSNATHGTHAFNNIPYQNKNNWGFNDKNFKQISERIWLLEKI